MLKKQIYNMKKLHVTRQKSVFLVRNRLIRILKVLMSILDNEHEKRNKRTYEQNIRYFQNLLSRFFCKKKNPSNIAF